MSARDLQRGLEHPDPQQLWYQLGEIVESRIYLQEGVEVRPGDVVLERRANIGVAAAFFAAECGAGAVHCFEPVRPVFEQLQRNVRHFPACIPRPYGLSSPIGQRHDHLLPARLGDLGPLRRSNGAGRHIEMGASQPGELRDRNRGEPAGAASQPRSCPASFATLSDALRRESIDRVDLIKIHVEKAELDVLAGIEDADWPSS